MLQLRIELFCSRKISSPANRTTASEVRNEADDPPRVADLHCDSRRQLSRCGLHNCSGLEAGDEGAA
jgi:hypothetical protein